MYRSACGGAPTEVRLQTDETPDGRWLWFKSQHLAGKWLFEQVLKTEHTQSKIYRLVTQNRDARDAARGAWVARFASNDTPPGHRTNTWYWLRNMWRKRQIVVYWMGQAAETAYAPGGRGRKRDLDAFQADFCE